ncbi:MAG: carboxypeptidase regulatory-like domain-containing protein, partial [Acidobacteriota bacterium]
MTRLVFIFAAVCAAQPAFARQPPPRDPRPSQGGQQRAPVAPLPVADSREPAAGVTAITGVVLSDERPARPLRRARVALNNADAAVGRTVITEDDGSFVFEPLSPGSYTLAAAKDGYVPINYGAKRPFRPGVPVAVRRGERRELRLVLTRGSVITGTVQLPDGQPAPRIGLTAVPYRYAAGDRRPVSAGIASALTDDRGVYRIFGLAAGRYILAALPGLSVTNGPLESISEADVRRALAEVRAPFSRAPAPAPPIAAMPPPTDTPGRTRPVHLATVYYPGTTVLDKATYVTLGPAEERRGVDFDLEYVPSATVSGALFLPGGMPQPQIVLSGTGDGPAAQLTRTALASSEGQFTLSDVDPGPYTVTSALMPWPRGAAAATQVLWASTELFVEGHDVTDLTLVPHAAVTIAGRVTFEGTTPPPKLAGLQVPLPALVRPGGRAVSQPSLRLEADGQFAIAGIIPGVYRLRTIAQGQIASLGGWWLKSVTVSGREILDTPLDLPDGADDAVVTFSDRATELRGRLTDSGRPAASGHVVVVCSANPSSWFFNSRRIAAIAPDAEGRYTIRNLPAGDYFVAVSNDLEPGEWYDPAVLEQLVKGASRITLA